MKHVTSTANHYPIPRQTPDYRLGFGLLADFRRLLLRHGFPEFGAGDLAELHLALDRFVYGPADGATPHRYPQVMVWAQEHGDLLVREADRRGIPDMDSLLVLMLDDVFPIYTDATPGEIEEDRAAIAEYRRDDEPPTNEPLPPGVEGRPLGGRQEGTPQ